MPEFAVKFTSENQAILWWAIANRGLRPTAESSPCIITILLGHKVLQEMPPALCGQGYNTLHQWYVFFYYCIGILINLVMIAENK